MPEKDVEPIQWMKKTAFGALALSSVALLVSLSNILKVIKELEKERSWSLIFAAAALVLVAFWLSGKYKKYPDTRYHYTDSFNRRIICLAVSGFTVVSIWWGYKDFYSFRPLIVEDTTSYGHGIGAHAYPRPIKGTAQEHYDSLLPVSNSTPKLSDDVCNTFNFRIRKDYRADEIIINNVYIHVASVTDTPPLADADTRVAGAGEIPVVHFFFRLDRTKPAPFSLEPYAYAVNNEPPKNWSQPLNFRLDEVAPVIFKFHIFGKESGIYTISSISISYSIPGGTIRELHIGSNKNVNTRLCYYSQRDIVELHQKRYVMVERESNGKKETRQEVVEEIIRRAPDGTWPPNVKFSEKKQ